MELHTMSFIFGAILLVVGLWGGGIEIKELKIPRVGGMARSLSLLIGIIFIFLGLWVGGFIGAEKTNGDQVIDDKKIAFTIKGSLGRVNELREIESKARIYVAGNKVIEISLDKDKPSDSVSVYVQKPGEYKYYFEGHSIWSNAPNDRVPISGNGIINVENGDAFEMRADEPPAENAQVWVGKLEKQ